MPLLLILKCAFMDVLLEIFYFTGHKTVFGLMLTLKKVSLPAVALNISGTYSKFPLVPVL